MRQLTEKSEDLDSAILSSLLKLTAGLVEAVLHAISRENGEWADGVVFLSSLLENELFRDHLRRTKELQNIAQTLKGFMSVNNIVGQLHSPSVVPFLHVLFSFCTLYNDEVPHAWNTLVAEAIPENRPINVGDPASLLASVVGLPRKSWSELNGFVQAPSGIHENLVEELTGAMKEVDPAETVEKKRLEELFKSLIEW